MGDHAFATAAVAVTQGGSTTACSSPIDRVQQQSRTQVTSHVRHTSSALSGF